ncbi:hypothetical protein MY10362_007314 [Beauveria mimosiformis]
MPAADANQASKKRKPSTSIANPAASKKPRPPPSDGLAPRPAHDSPLCAPHAPILQDLGAKYDVLPASVISSTPIRKRLEYITTHLLGGGAGGGGGGGGRKKPRVVLLCARAAEVCKMITVVEKCKRLLEEQGEAAWYQYNQLFDVPREEAERATRKREERKKKKRVVGETVLNVEEGEKKEGKEEEEEEEEEEDDGDASDAFETMQSRFEKAVVPPAPDRTTKSLRIFLSTVAIPELKAKDGVTVQTSGK